MESTRLKIKYQITIVAGIQAGPGRVFYAGGIWHDERRDIPWAFEVVRTKRGQSALNKSFGDVDGCETGR